MSSAQEQIDELARFILTEDYGPFPGDGGAVDVAMRVMAYAQHRPDCGALPDHSARPCTCGLRPCEETSC